MKQPPNTRDIQAFNMVAIELSFRRAAERLAIDQSALSRRIKQLEDQLGYQLIRRTTREVSLTSAGEVFYERTRMIYSEIQSAMHAGQIAAEGKKGTLRVGYMSFAAIELMPRIVKEFSNLYPDVELELKYFRTQGQKIELYRNGIDVGFMLGPFRHPQIETKELRTEDFVAILSTEHRLSTRSFVTLEELSRYPMVLGNVEQWEFYRIMIEDLFTNIGRPINVSYEASNALGILGLVGSGLGFSIYAESIQRFQPRTIVTKPIADCEPKIPTLLAWNRAYKSPALMNFIKVAEKVALDL